MFKIILNEIFINCFNISDETRRMNFFLVLSTYIIFSILFYFIFELYQIPNIVNYIMYMALVPFFFISFISMSIRRLNDSGMSPSWIFINFIPTLGNIVFFIIMFLPSDPIQTD